MAITQENINKAIELAKEYGATRLLLFGSALNDPQNANDIDLAVDGINGMDFFKYAGKLEFILNIPIDIVDLSQENRFIDHIKKTGKYLYDSTGTVS
jgi:uncharacterized protein